MARLRAAPEVEGYEMLVWGDILANHPGSAAKLPDGLTVCEWGYDDWWPFNERCSALAEAGRPFWVAPGTSSWLSLLGRVTNTIGDCRVAARAAAEHGAVGLLNTDWGDMGHLQYLPVSDPGFAAGAAMAWCLSANEGLDPAGMARALDLHSFDDPAGELGAALVALGDVHRIVGPQLPNMSILCLPLYRPRIPLGEGPLEALTIEDLHKCEQAIGEAVDALGRSRSRRSDAPLVLDELRASASLVALLCRDAQSRLHGDGSIGSVPVQQREALAADLAPMLERHEALWLARNRPGGLSDSLAWLEGLLAVYEGEGA
jgi:hypothetical protein